MSESGPSWWNGRRIGLAAGGALVVALVAFVYRFNALDGSLGGFTNDQFAHLMRADMLLRGEQPLRDFAAFELRGAWPALSYAVPAWAQQLWGPTLLAEAYLSIGALAVAHSAVFVLALELSKRWSVALLASVLTLAMEPRLYSFQKILMLAAGAAAMRAAMLMPSRWTLAAAAATTAVATLFRHDCGVYVGAGVIAGLVARDAGAWGLAARRAGTYVALTMLFLLPSAIWVQVYEGIPSYIVNNLRIAGLEAARTALNVPPLAPLVPPTADGLIALTYYAFWAVVIAAAAACAFQALATTSRFDPAERGTAVGLLAMALLGNNLLLRDALTARFGDAVIPIALLAAWTAGRANGIPRAGVRRLVALVPAVLLVFMLGATWVFAEVPETIDDTGFAQSWSAVTGQFRSVRSNLLRQPPEDWSRFPAEDTLVAARYLAQCTAPDDHVLVAAEAPEIPVYARRRFAAGQATMSLSMYTSERDQRRALARLASQSVPIVLVNANRIQEDFVQAYPLLARHVFDRYREAGTIDGGGMRFLVFVEADRKPSGVDPHLGLPCFQ